MQKSLNRVLPNKIDRLNMVLKLVVVLVLLAGLAGAVGQKTAKADVILPDQKSVDYCFSISNLNDFPDYVIIESHFRLGGPEVIQNGVCKEDAKHNVGKFYAAKKATFDASQLPQDTTNTGFLTGNPNFLPATLTVSPAYVIDKDSPVVKIQDVLKIIKITSTELQLEKSSVIYTYSDGSTEELPYQGQDTRPAPARDSAGINLWWYLLVPALALAVVAFIVLQKNRKTPKKVY